MSDALLSPCGTYRYTLGRDLVGIPTMSHKPCLFVMLNPSTADATLDDPTGEGDWDDDCGSCLKPMHISRHISVTYSTAKAVEQKP